MVHSMAWFDTMDLGWFIVWFGFDAVDLGWFIVWLGLMQWT